MKLIGSLLSFYQKQPHQWVYIELKHRKKPKLYEWHEIHWREISTLRYPNLTFFTFDPDEARWIIWVINQGVIYRVPVFTVNETESSTPTYKVSQVFKPQFNALGALQWGIVNGLKATSLGLDLSQLPENFNYSSIEQVRPELPTIILPDAPIKMQAVKKKTMVCVEDAWRNLDEVSRRSFSKLTSGQESLIVSLISVDGTWPVKLHDSTSRQIASCLDVLTRSFSPASTAPDDFMKYYHPMTLAKIMRGSFYSYNVTAGEDNHLFLARVSDVWCFINALLKSALQLLGYKKEPRLALPPKGTGVTSRRYLALNESSVREAGSLFSNEDMVYQLLLDDIERIDNPILDDLSTEHRATIAVILSQLYKQEAIVTHLSTKIIIAVRNLLGVTDENACDLVRDALKKKLTEIYLKEADVLIEKIKAPHDLSTEAALRDLICRFPFPIDVCNLRTLSRHDYIQLIGLLRENIKNLYQIESLGELNNMFYQLPHELHLTVIPHVSNEICAYINSADAFESLLDVLAVNAQKALINQLGAKARTFNTPDVLKKLSSSVRPYLNNVIRLSMFKSGEVKTSDTAVTPHVYGA